jgi:hypothetical protein
MGHARAKVAGASVVLVGSGLALFFSLYDPPPAEDPRPHLAVGQAMAQATTGLLGNGGAITLVVRDTSVFPSPATEAQIKGFLTALGKQGLRVAATNAVKLDPIRLVRVHPGDFLELLRRQKEGDVVASFLGPALLDGEQQAKLGDKHARVVALCCGDIPRQMDLRGLFDRDLLQAAIISRPNPPLTSPPSEDLEAWFAHFYQVITPANLAALPGTREDRKP